MSPSSPVSVGMCPSNRTLEAGSLQVLFAYFEQFPVAEEPFTDVGGGDKVYLPGITVKK